MTTADLKHSTLTDKLINTYYSLYNELGYGFLESIYQKAFALMLREQGIGFREQAPIRVLSRVWKWASSWPMYWSKAVF